MHEMDRKRRAGAVAVSRRRPLCRDRPNHPTGIAGGKDIGRDLPCDHTAGADDRLRANRDARTENGPAANPNIRADSDGFGELLDAT